MGVEPTNDGIARRSPVLKTGTITGPHALPQGTKAIPFQQLESRGFQRNSGGSVLVPCSIKFAHVEREKPQAPAGVDLAPRLKLLYKVLRPRPKAEDRVPLRAGRQAPLEDVQAREGSRLKGDVARQLRRARRMRESDYCGVLGRHPSSLCREEPPAFNSSLLPGFMGSPHQAALRRRAARDL